MKPEKITALRAAAIAAGGEEWWLSGDHDTVWGADGDSVCKTFDNLGHHPEPIDERQLAEFIAEACPATILALLDHIDQLRAATISECAEHADAVSAAHRSAYKTGRSESRGNSHVDGMSDGASEAADVIRSILTKEEKQ